MYKTVDKKTTAGSRIVAVVVKLEEGVFKLRV